MEEPIEPVTALRVKQAPAFSWQYAKISSPGALSPDNKKGGGNRSPQGYFLSPSSVSGGNGVPAGVAPCLAISPRSSCPRMLCFLP